MTVKRCICGRSNSFPICDGTHGSQNWNCTPSSFTKTIVLTCPHYHSFGEWLSYQHQGIAAHQQIGGQCEELIIVHDGCNMALLQQQILQIPHQRQRWLHTHDVLPKDWPTSATSKHFHLPVEDLNIASFSWDKATPISALPRQTYKIFASHAILDEKILTPAIDVLQTQYQQAVFYCRKSIPLGELWQNQIENELHNTHIVWAFISKNFLQSTFCAFEIGYAKALHKRIIPIVLDDSPIPAYIQEYNALYHSRHEMLQPWLNESEVILDMCLTVLTQLQNP